MCCLLVQVGHWLGLEHTFERHSSASGCSAPGDYVDDTPAVAFANFQCARGTDSCPNDGQGPDMVENFMDYTDDNCKNTLTSGQGTRMYYQWWAYRGASFEGETKQ